MIKKLLGAAALVGLAGSANAAQIFFDPGVPTPPGANVVFDFDTTIPAGFTNTATVQIKNSSDGDGAAPATGSGDYLSVLGGGSYTLNFAQAVGGFSFDWGSVDTYNTLTINLVGGGTIVRTGGQVAAPADGGQGAAATNGLFSVFADAGESFTGFTLTSDSNSFEIDNVALAVPEPATWAMMIGGFGMVGGTLRRRARSHRMVLA